MTTISEFKGPYAFLSNFYQSPVDMTPPFPALVPFRYATAEHAYQAAKAVTREDHDRIAAAATPGDAKKIGRRVKARADWDLHRLAVMTQVIEAKFAYGTELAARLVSTGEAELVEGNYWGDDFWGVYQGRGQNMLGTILMAHRRHLVSLAEITSMDYKKEFEDAMRASNAAGCVGMSPAQTIECLDAQMRRTCPMCAGAGTVSVLVGGGPDARDEDVTCPMCNGSCVVSAVVNIPSDSAEYDNLIRRVFLANGFTIKEGQEDLKSYVYTAARALVNELTGARVPK